MIYGTAWTAERVIERVTAGMSVFARDNAVIYAADGHVWSWQEDGKLAPVDGLQILVIGKHILGRDTYRQFEAHVLAAIGRTAPITVIRNAMGWSSSTHDRKVKEAAEKIAEYLRQHRLPLDGGNSDVSPFRMGDVVRFKDRIRAAAREPARIIAFPVSKAKKPAKRAVVIPLRRAPVIQGESRADA